VSFPEDFCRLSAVDETRGAYPPVEKGGENVKMIQEEPHCSSRAQIYKKARKHTAVQATDPLKLP
jgi:hypothetical protein